MVCSETFEYDVRLHLPLFLIAFLSLYLVQYVTVRLHLAEPANIKHHTHRLCFRAFIRHSQTSTYVHIGARSRTRFRDECENESKLYCGTCRSPPQARATDSISVHLRISRHLRNRFMWSQRRFDKIALFGQFAWAYQHALLLRID